jgi:hypothetical protein
MGKPSAGSPILRSPDRHFRRGFIKLAPVERRQPTPDELDKEQIDQLHAAVVEISGNCFELKKLCATVLVGAGTLIATFTDKRLDSSIFIGGLLILTIFWLADSQSYYYQRKLRLRMADLQERRVRRANLRDYPVNGVGLPVEPDRASVWRAIFNLSMTFYGLLAAVILLTWTLHLAGAIGS